MHGDTIYISTLLQVWKIHTQSLTAFQHTIGSVPEFNTGIIMTTLHNKTSSYKTVLLLISLQHILSQLANFDRPSLWFIHV